MYAFLNFIYKKEKKKKRDEKKTNIFTRGKIHKKSQEKLFVNSKLVLAIIFTILITAFESPEFIPRNFKRAENRYWQEVFTVLTKWMQC